MMRSLCWWLAFASVCSVPYAVVGSDAPPVEEASCTAEQGCEDPSSLLQSRRLTGHHRLSQQSSLGKKAVTFQGGGFASVSTQAAILAGLMASVAPAGTKPTLEGTGVLKEFEVLSSNSGGSWFIGGMLYSSNMVEMVEEMAANPSDAGTIFNEQYMNAWLSKAEAAKDMPDLMDFTASMGWNAMYDQIQWTNMIFNAGSWAGWVQELLNETSYGQIDDETTLADSLPWAKDKAWIVCHSQVAPTGDDAGALLAANAMLSQQYLYKLTGVSAGTSVPPYLPARFSVSLGVGADAPAPLSYLGNSDLAASAGGMWEATWAYGVTHCDDASPPYGDFDNFVHGVGKLPVYSVVAASSATFGGLTTVPNLREMNSQIQDIGPMMAVWAAINEAEPFQAANEILKPVAVADAPVTEKINKQLAKSGLFPLVDGSYTDNTAISHVISAGVTEVTSFVVWGSMKNLFSPSRTETPTWSSTGGQNPSVVFPILTFENLPPNFTSAQHYAEHLRNNTFSQLTSTADASQSYTTPIIAGVFDCITLENLWFGIPAGRKVKINYVGGGDFATLGVGAGVDLADFGVAVGGMVQEVVAAQQENLPAYNLLKSFFFSS